jgi:cyclopropane-fatty-acyl-phospholipid synthase
LQETYGEDALMWWVRWRLFYISCSEFFGAKHGTASGVGHYLFKKR